MRVYILIVGVVAAIVLSCGPAEKSDGSAETASTAEEAPAIETLRAPTAAQDILWEEWSPAGVDAAKMDWPAGAVWTSGKLYLMGTRKLAGAADGPRDRAEVVVVEILAGGTREVATYPSRFAERAHAAVAAGPDGRVWFLGGMYTPPPMGLAPEGRLDFAELETPVGEVYTWRPGAKELELEAYLPVPRGDAAAFFSGKDLFVIGGTFDPADPVAEFNHQMHSFSPAEGVWKKYHELPVPLASPAATVAAGGIYVIGGKQLKPAHVTNAVYRYDLTYYKWQKVPTLPAPRAGAAAYTVGDYIYVVGGCEAEALGTAGRMGLKTYRYDLQAKKWEELATPLPEGCAYSAYDGTNFYLIGAGKTYRGRIVKAKAGT
ncbi:MAG: kelch repeat-containing protein [Candidatus Zixiibacteriota bacterium]